MFSNANVKIYGGSFREITGDYTHNETHTYTNNHNSNNITGNTLTESHVDNSRTICALSFNLLIYCFELFLRQ